MSTRPTNTTDDEGDLSAQWEKSLDSGSAGSDGFAPRKQLNQNEIDSVFGDSYQSLNFEDKNIIRRIIENPNPRYETLPILEIVFDRLVRFMTTTLRKFTSDQVEVYYNHGDTLRFQEAMYKVPFPSMLSVFKAPEWDNYGMIMVDSDLVFSMVDVLLGGRRSEAIQPDGRPYTSIEQNLVIKMVQKILDDLRRAFEPVAEVHFELERVETNPRFALITRPRNVVRVATLKIDMDKRGGTLQIIIPYATLEPIRPVLLQQYMGEKFGRDKIWEKHLNKEFDQTRLNISAILEAPSIPIGDVLDWKVGDVIEVMGRPNEPVPVVSDGREMFYGYLGQKNGMLSVKIDRLLFNAEKSI
jgi:flagellar motor switch protein FliM